MDFSVHVSNFILQSTYIFRYKRPALILIPLPHHSTDIFIFILYFLTMFFYFLTLFLMSPKSTS